MGVVCVRLRSSATKRPANRRRPFRGKRSYLGGCRCAATTEALRPGRGRATPGSTRCLFRDTGGDTSPVRIAAGAIRLRRQAPGASGSLMAVCPTPDNVASLVVALPQPTRPPRLPRRCRRQHADAYVANEIVPAPTTSRPARGAPSPAARLPKRPGPLPGEGVWGASSLPARFFSSFRSLALLSLPPCHFAS